MADVSKTNERLRTKEHRNELRKAYGNDSELRLVRITAGNIQALLDELDSMEAMLATEEQRTAAVPAASSRWVITEYEYLDCEKCGRSYYTGCDSTQEAREFLASGKAYPYCPHCGRRMV